MPSARTTGSWVAAIVFACAARAAADDAVQPVAVTGVAHLTSAATAHTAGGSDLRLPPGWFLDEAAWAVLDTETRRLQDAETRLTAENKSLRTATESWQPGWYTLVTAFAGGCALTWYVKSKL